MNDFSDQGIDHRSPIETKNTEQQLSLKLKMPAPDIWDKAILQQLLILENEKVWNSFVYSDFDIF